jgi:DNA-binding FadR family transcriptional regulator
MIQWQEKNMTLECLQVIEKLVDLVLTDTAHPYSDEKIYSENRMARVFGLPRAQVREVYSALQALGLLYGKQGKGTYLKAMDFEQGGNLLYLMMIMEKASFEDIVAVRKILEISSVELAAKNRTKKDITAMRSCLEKMERWPEFHTMAKEDVNLHLHIAAASGNPLLRYLMQIIGGYISRIIMDHWALLSTEEDLVTGKKFMAEHRKMVEAIADGQPDEARNVLSAHMDGLIISIKKNQNNLPNWNRRGIGL